MEADIDEIGTTIVSPMTLHQSNISPTNIVPLITVKLGRFLQMALCPWQAQVRDKDMVNCDSLGNVQLGKCPMGEMSLEN